MSIPVFVYGTLRTKAKQHHLIEPFVLRVKDGSVRGTLVDAGNGAYPALILDRKAEPIIGEWIFVNPEALKKMDEYEGYLGPGKENEYERTWVRDAIHDEEGWAYVWRSDKGCAVLKTQDWLEVQA